MRRFTVSAIFAALLSVAWLAGPQTSTRAAAGGSVSGQGKYQFRVLYTSTHLPAEAQKVLKAAHGGFAVDRRSGKGETYFALPGAGIVQISGDLKSTRMIPTDPAMRDTNMHNTTLWFGQDRKPYLSFPGNQSASVFTTTIDGKLVSTLKTPAKGVDLGFPLSNDYFAQGGNFVPTDTTELDNILYVATGYSKLDTILTAKVISPKNMEWFDLSWGGKGTGVGQFGTGHGLTVKMGTKMIDVADRPHSEIDRFTRHGQYLSTLSLPKGSFPCDIDYRTPNQAIVGALHGPDRKKGAPIYIIENDELVSTIMPKEELGLANFQHIHNAVLHEINGKLYVIAQAWNPGDFAILEQVSN
jgi:hypothetical protein